MGSTSHGCANSECGRVKQHVNQLCHDGQLAIIRTGDDDGIELGIDRRRLTWSRSTGRTWAYECNSTRCSGSGTPAWCWPPPNGSTLSLATGATSHPHPGGLPAQQPFGGRLCRTHRTQGRGDSVRGALAGRQPETRRRGPARRRRDHQPPHRQQVPGSETDHAAFAASRTDLARIFATCASGQELIHRDFHADVEHASRLDCSNTAPLLCGDSYVDANATCRAPARVGELSAAPVCTSPVPPGSIAPVCSRTHSR